jgi:integrase
MARKQKRGESKWRIEVFGGRDEKGRQTFAYSETFEGSEKQAEARTVYLQVCHDQGMNLKEMKLGGVTTFNQLLDDWLEIVKKPKCTFRTYLDYVRYCRLYFRPALGATPVREITTLMLQKHMQQLAARGIGPRILVHCRSYLSNIFKEALNWNLVKLNPALGLKAPKLKKRKFRLLDREEMARLLDVCRNDPAGIMILVSMITAVRPGELIALKWEDCELDTEHPQIRIERAYVNLHDGPGAVGEKWEFGPPKTEAGRRTVPIPAWLAELLREHRETQDYSAAANPYHLIFPASRKGNPMQPWNLRKYCFEPILKRAGLEHMRLYDLRHSAATWMVRQTRDAEAVSKIIGHASVKFTLDTYVHSDTPRHREVMNDAWASFDRSEPTVSQSSEMESELIN